jgi:DNA mismatch endonuclease, patch repair protein
MADVVDRATRSRMMSGIRNRDTDPEKKVRQYLHSRGLRFRLHKADLPGKPDIVLKRYMAAILVHGCFWHQHPGCSLARMPKSNVGFWKAKLEANVARDRRTRERLMAGGWRVFEVWECETNEHTLNELFRAITDAA